METQETEATEMPTDMSAEEQPSDKQPPEAAASGATPEEQSSEEQPQAPDMPLKEKPVRVRGKNTPGYINRYRKTNIIWLAVWILIGVGIFITGILIWDTRANLLTVLAVLAVLPGAKRIVALVAVGRKKSVAEARCHAVETEVEPFIYAGDLDIHEYETEEVPANDSDESSEDEPEPELIKLPIEETVIFTDYIFTSTEKVMMLDFLVVTDGEVFVLPTANSADIDYIKKYLKNGVRKQSESVSFIVVKDDAELLRKLKERSDKAISDADRYDLLAYLKSLAV